MQKQFIMITCCLVVGPYCQTLDRQKGNNFERLLIHYSLWFVSVESWPFVNVIAEDFKLLCV